MKTLNTRQWSLLVTLFAFLLLTINSVKAQSFESLIQLPNHQINTYYSEGAHKQAKIMADRCDRVMAFYQEQFDFVPTVTLLVLSASDWSQFTDFPVYGMPHYNDQQTLIVAAEDNDFWNSFIPNLDQLPEDFATEIVETYTDADENLTMRGFFDLLAIHELGHAFHIQGGLKMQRNWMGELFANIFLHTYIAENEPRLLPALTLFPKMVVSSINMEDLKFTSLPDLESNYNLIGQNHPKNYGWYQCRWHMAAANIYDEGGMEALQNLWLMLKSNQDSMDDETFVKSLNTDAHPSIANVYLNWDAK